MRGLLIAAASSGAGKTVVTLGLLAALARRGIEVRAAKSGPDYIDPQFHAVVLGRPSVTLDAWAMGAEDLAARASADPGELLVVEGAMGVLDGARPDGRGSAADLAEALGLPVVLMLDIAASAQSAVLAPLGLAAARPGLVPAGVILNRAGSEAHAEMARLAMDRIGVRVLGTLARDAALAVPSRHLGLVQAAELPGLPALIDRAARAVEAGVDLDRLLAAAAPLPPAGRARPIPPPGQRIAVARDIAFAFAYPHMLADWRRAGAEIQPFSPLADEPPDPLADTVVLPGGYPELHAGRLAAASRYLGGLREAAARGATVYGECGGYMVLGRGLVDAEGRRHAMAGLLPLETSFADQRRALGYRRLCARPGAPFAGRFAAHEHHRATILSEGEAPRLFEATDAAGTQLPPMGLRLGRVSGSFAHLIAPLAD